MVATRHRVCFHGGGVASHGDGTEVSPGFTHEFGQGRCI